MDNTNTDQPNNMDQPNPMGQTPNTPSSDVPPMSSSVNSSPVPSQPMPESTPANTEEPKPSTSSDEAIVSSSSSGSGDSKKPMGMMIGALLVLIVIFLGLLFFFVFNKPSEPQQPTQQVPVEDLQPSPTSVVTPTPELSEEVIDDIDIGSPEAELAPIQEDLEELE